MWSEVELRHQSPTRAVGTLVVRLLRVAVAVWVVLEARAGVLTSGPLAERLAVAVIVASVFTLLGLATDQVVHGPRPRAVTAVLAVPAALLLTVPISDVLALPFEVSGLWGLLLATLAIITIAFQAGRIPQTLLNGYPGRLPAILFGGFALAFVGLGLADTILAGAHMPGTTEDRIATLVVLAALFRVGGGNLLYFNGYGLAASVWSVIGPFLVGALKLWALCWLSSWMASPLRIDGFDTFVYAAAIVWAFTAWIWLYEQVSRENALREAEHREQQWLRAEQQQAMLNMTTWLALDTARYVSRVAEEKRRRDLY